MHAVARDHIAWFETLGNHDVSRVGGKNASLGEMVRELAPRGVRVPQDFATTAAAYNSISLNPDTFVAAAREVARTELARAQAAGRARYERGELPV